MFAATILLCLTAAGAAEPQCGLIADRRGPVLGEERCRGRLGEMEERVKAVLSAKGFVGTVRLTASCKRVQGEARA
jgi:hypothetical protein